MRSVCARGNSKGRSCLLSSCTDSGMKEDLALYGKELNYATAIWSAAYVFGQIPSNLLLTRVSLHDLKLRRALKF